MEFYFKRHISGEKVVVGICDSELVGRKFSENGMALNVSEYFFKGELADEGKIAEIVKNAGSLNLIGKKIIEICIDLGVVERENVQEISSIPYALVFNIGKD